MLADVVADCGIAERVVAVCLHSAALGVRQGNNAAQAIGMVEIIDRALLHGQKLVNIEVMGVAGNYVTRAVIGCNDSALVVHIAGRHAVNCF